MVSGHAGVAELVDALAWGASELRFVEVQVFSLAPKLEKLLLTVMDKFLVFVVNEKWYGKEI